MKEDTMSYDSHLDVKVATGLLKSITNFFPIKAALALIGLCMSWVFNGDTEVLKTIYILIGIDTFLGVWNAARCQDISSRGFYRVTVKCLIYFIMIIVGRLVDKHAPIQFAAPIMDSFLVGTEAFSILENISKLGFPVPQKLIKMMKIQNEKK